MLLLGKYRKKRDPEKEGPKLGRYLWYNFLLEELVNGTPPEAISPHITSQDDLNMNGVKVIVQEIPSINIIPNSWKILQTIGETLAAKSYWECG